MRVLGWLLKPIAALLIVACVVIGAGLAYYGAPLTDAPGIGTRLARYLTGAPVETKRYSAYPELRIRNFARPPEEVFEAAVDAVKAMGWRVAAVNEEEFSLQAVATYPIPEIKGDISIKVSETEDGHSELHVQSDTRGPWPDFGSNTRRIMELNDKVSALL